MGRAPLPRIAASASFAVMGGKVGAKAERGQEPMRIAKAIAQAGLCSRRDAERMIEAGRVAVNGKTLATPAQVVSAADRITVDGKPLPQRQAPRLWRYHKPRGLVTSHKDPQGRKTCLLYTSPSPRDRS